MALFLNGCVIGRYAEGPEFADEKIEDIKPAIATKEKNIDWFGTPAEFRATSDLLVIFIDDNERVKYFGFQRATEESD